VCCQTVSCCHGSANTVTLYNSRCPRGFSAIVTDVLRCVARLHRVVANLPTLSPSTILGALGGFLPS
jgi:hypothetical protein